MSTVVSVAGSNYSVPQEGDSGWANDVTNLLIQLATSSKVLQITSTSFPLLQELSFGNTYGLKLAYVKSQAANPSSVGTIRLGNAETVSWRNAANNADLDLKVSATDELQYNSVKIPVSGSIVNADVNAAAAIAYSKLNIADGDLTIAKTSGLQTALNTAAPMTTEGDMIRGGVSGVPTRLPIGTLGYIMRSTGTLPEWSSAITVSASGDVVVSSTGNKLFSIYSTTGGGTSEIDIGSTATVGGCTLKLIANAAGTGLTITRSAGTNNVSQIIHYGTSKFSIICNGAASLGFNTTNTERMLLDASGNLSLTTLAGTGNRMLQASSTGVISSVGFVGASAKNSSGQSIASGSDVKVTGYTEDYDTAGAFNPTTGEFTVPSTGYYQVSAHFEFASGVFNATQTVRLGLLFNGSPVLYLFDQVVRENATSEYNLPGPPYTTLITAGTVVAFSVFQNTGGARTLQASGTRNWISIIKVGLS